MSFAHAYAPIRIGIAGGGTDLPVWTHERSGRSLTLAVASYTHVAVITRPDHHVVASYRRREEVTSTTELANSLIRETALAHGFDDGFEVHILSEISSMGSGLGVSSSISVALEAAFSALKTSSAGAFPEIRWVDGGVDGFRQGVAEGAWKIEIDRLRRPIGRQDHMAAAWGGLRLYAYEGDKASVVASFSAEDAAWLASRLALVQLPQGHDSREILSKVTTCDMLEAASRAVPLAIDALKQRSVEGIGRALILGQAAKQAIPGALPHWISDLCQRVSMVKGVHGVKVAGSGGGGHLLVACEPGVKEGIQTAVELPVIAVKPDLLGVRRAGWV